MPYKVLLYHYGKRRTRPFHTGWSNIMGKVMGWNLDVATNKVETEKTKLFIFISYLQELLPHKNDIYMYRKVLFSSFNNGKLEPCTTSSSRGINWYISRIFFTQTLCAENLSSICSAIEKQLADQEKW